MFGELIVAYLFLGGTGAGACAVLAALGLLADRDDVARGMRERFRDGDKLPTVRGLASEISINYNTVNKAYLSLVSDGYLESTRGRGVFVTDMAAAEGGEGRGEADAVLDDCIAACRDLGMDYDDIERAMGRKIKRLKHEEARQRGEVSARIIDFEQSVGRKAKEA